jgi:hypothetical protein
MSGMYKTANFFLPTKSQITNIECGICGVITDEYVVQDGLPICDPCAGNLQSERMNRTKRYRISS